MPLRWVLLLSLVSACGPAQNGASSGMDEGRSGLSSIATSAEPAGIVEGYIDRVLDLSPGLGRGLGLHQYDGRIRPITRASADEEIAHARQHLALLTALHVETVPEPTRLDLELTKLHAERTIFGLEVLQTHRKILSYSGLFDVSSYLVRDYAPAEQRVSSMLDHVGRATKEVDSLIALLEPKQPRTHLETARKIFEGMREYYDGDVSRQSAPALDHSAELKARYAVVIPAGLAAVDRIIRWIDDVGMKNATDDFALGEEKFLRLLEVNEGVRTSMAELEAMAKADFERNYEAFESTAKRIDPKLSVRAVAEEVAKERLGKNQVLETARKQLDELRAFIESNDIVTIGSEDRATVEVTPPFMRWNSAFLDSAGPFEKAKGSFYYISPPDPSWPKEVQESYLPYEGDLLATSIHEVYPGHFIQGLHQRNAPTRAQKILDSYAFVEGWAHYTEQMMLDAGFGKDDPKLKLGQLSNALLRNCRFLAAIALHTRGMTVKAADQLFQEKCFIDPGNAVQQAYRGTFDPGYMSYTFGKLQILALRDRFFEKRGTKSLRAFHDWLLSFGNAPVALIEHRL